MEGEIIVCSPIRMTRNRTVPGSRAFVHPPKRVDGSNEKIQNLYKERHWIFCETFMWCLNSNMPKILGYAYLKQQTNPLGCEFFCNKSGITDRVLQVLF